MAQSEFLVVAVLNVMEVVDRNVSPAEVEQHVFLVVVVDRCAFQEDQHVSLDVGRCEWLEVAAQCSVADQSVCSAVAALTVEGVH